MQISCPQLTLQRLFPDICVNPTRVVNVQWGVAQYWEICYDCQDRVIRLSAYWQVQNETNSSYSWHFIPTLLESSQCSPHHLADWEWECPLSIPNPQFSTAQGIYLCPNAYVLAMPMLLKIRCSKLRSVLVYYIIPIKCWWKEQINIDSSPIRPASVPR